MRPTSAFLALSVAGNLALVSAFLIYSPRKLPVSPAAAASKNPGPLASGAKDAAALQSALATADTAALTAAGCPPEVIRWVSTGRAFDTFQARMRTLRPVRTDDRYWRRSGEEDNRSRGPRIEENRAERDFSEAVRQAYGEDLESMFNDRNSGRSFLPAAKQEQLRRIERDYAEMEQQIESEQTDVQLPSDQEKLRLLRAEKERDIAAALTPEEREQFELRTSPTAANIRNRFGDAIQTEEEYRRIFALQKAFDDRFNHPNRDSSGPPSPDEMRARRDAEQKLQEDIRAAIDPAQWAAAQRASDPDLRTLNSLAQRLGLPPATADSVLATRETYAAQSMEINANSALSAQERRSQLQALATRARNELQGTLGAEGAQVFAQRAQWMNMLKNGQAFSTNPKDSWNPNVSLGMSVYPVQPRVPPPPAAPPKQ